MLFLYPIVFAGLYLLYTSYCLGINYRAAKRIGVPIVIVPVSPENPIWMLTGNRIASFVEFLFGESHFTRFSIRGWVYYDKNRAALELGDHFVFVTPGKIWFYVCNPDTLNEVIHRFHDFPRPTEILAMLDVFGPNVSTVEGAEWQRQRKITSGPFNEQNSKLVWSESIRQAQDVLMFWTSQKAPITRSANHIRTLSLHVLSCAGFGKSYSFQKAGEPPKPGHLFNYRDALAHVLDHIMLILVVGPRLLTSRYLPKHLQSIGQATLDFKAYMKDMYDEEKQALADSRQASANIMTSLIHATGEVDGGPTSKHARGLSESEVYGNTFVYNFAGHDTTAITFGWTLYLLAAHPEVQEWIGEEIDEMIKDDDLSKVEYCEAFPRMKRCLAVMVCMPTLAFGNENVETATMVFADQNIQLEVLRLYNPLPGIIKSTGEIPRDLTIDGKTVTIPAGARVNLHTDAIHTHPQYWGSDAMNWRPKRWMLHSNGEIPKVGNESLISPQKGTYAPWSGGPRICPGKKFGQVEFVAVVATLFKNHRVQVVPNHGESEECARARAMATVKDSAMVLLLQMVKPEQIGLRWVTKAPRSA
ncbi:hypothetical protein ACLMJK_003433 [Lecanora helva]